MSLRDVLGLYGPNKPVWSLDAKKQILDSRVSWVVWRLDADPAAPQWLYENGLNVIAQAPDRFNANPWSNPSHAIYDDYNHVAACCPPGTPFVHDNEPQYGPKIATAWHAEQWTRYSRAYMATWRWLDPGGIHPLITPALAVGPDRNGRLWHSTQWENLVEADGIGLHAYWQMIEQLEEPDFGDPESLVLEYAGDKPLYVLEYGNTLPGLTHADTLVQYTAFLHLLPERVRCAALFGVDLTNDWRRFHITRDVIEWLACLE